ncbi:hypothetical protein BDN71DRAFT_1434501 [Pleurotus eryngii]|uniref:Alpha-type protein kinase domain-containing protein n=1 Tax=Pleurotus eryngii TaxID=5323 RepID=A0A9P6D4G3_PLEER|nr:hypothetical protein BDN71DRAFT_1434501 [Pleurotus eryngii]
MSDYVPQFALPDDTQLDLSTILNPRPEVPLSTCPTCNTTGHMSSLQHCEGTGKRLENYGRWYQLFNFASLNANPLKRQQVLLRMAFLAQMCCSAKGGCDASGHCGATAPVAMPAQDSAKKATAMLPSIARTYAPPLSESYAHVYGDIYRKRQGINEGHKVAEQASIELACLPNGSPQHLNLSSMHARTLVILSDERAFMTIMPDSEFIYTYDNGSGNWVGQDIRAATTVVKQFPVGLYTCDFVHGMVILDQAVGDEQIKAAFAKAFPHYQFVRATVYANRKTFRNLQQTHADLLQTYVNFGRTKEGLWASFRAAIASLPSAVASSESTMSMDTTDLAPPITKKDSNGPNYTICTVWIEHFHYADGIIASSYALENDLLNAIMQLPAVKMGYGKSIYYVHTSYNGQQVEFAFKILCTALAQQVADDLAVATWQEALCLYECRLLAESFHERAVELDISIFLFTILPAYFVASGRMVCIGQEWSSGIKYPLVNHIEATESDDQYTLHFCPTLFIQIINTNNNVKVFIYLESDSRLVGELIFLLDYSHDKSRKYPFIRDDGNRRLDQYTQTHLCNIICKKLGLVPLVTV